MAWSATNLIKLTNDQRVSFGNRTELNDLTALSLLLCVKADSWFPTSRKLLFRQGQLSINVQGGGAPLINIGVAPTPTGALVFRGFADTLLNRARLADKAAHFLCATYDHGVWRAWIDGLEVQLTGTGTVPTKLTSVQSDLFMGFTDKLKATVGNLALWPGTILTPDQAVACWNRWQIADLSTGVASGPRGQNIDVPIPPFWWPGSDDVFPDVAPRCGTVHGTMLGTSPFAHDPVIPISPYAGPDAVAKFRFALKSGKEGYDTEPYASVPAFLALVNGHFLANLTRGSGHSTPNQKVRSQLNRNDGIGWAWPFSVNFPDRTWPGEIEAESIVLDTTETARGNAMDEAPDGTVIEWCNFVNGQTPPLSNPPPGPPPDPNVIRWLLVRDSRTRDAEGNPIDFSTWRYTLDVGTYWTSAPTGAKMIVRADGTWCKAVYYRDLPGNGPYSMRWILSALGPDQGIVWTNGELIWDGTIDGLPHEEPQPGWYVDPSTGAIELLVVHRVDHADIAKLYVQRSTDEGRTFTAPTYLCPGYNTPVWRQLPTGEILLLTRKGVPGPNPNLDLAKSIAFVSRDGLVTVEEETWLGRGNDGCNMGHALEVASDGRVFAMVASAHVGTPYTGSTTLEFMELQPWWAL